MYNKFTPLEEGTLLTRIKDYLKEVNFPVKKLEVMDGSKRSGHSNAYFSGMGKNKRIALFDTLMEQMDEDEILSVVKINLKKVIKMIKSGEIQDSKTICESTSL